MWETSVLVTVAVAPDALNEDAVATILLIITDDDGAFVTACVIAIAIGLVLDGALTLIIDNNIIISGNAAVLFIVNIFDSTFVFVADAGVVGICIVHRGWFVRNCCCSSL